MKKILYITSRLPALSVTFIDREIRVLAAAGYDIRTVSRSTPLKGEASEESLDYYRNTLYLDQVSIYRQLIAQLQVLVCKPLDWFRIVGLIFSENEVKNFRDRLRLLKHLVEAGYVFTRIKNEGISHIHSHFLNAPTTIAFCLSRFLKIPYSFTLHGSNIHLDPLMLMTKLIHCKKAVSISEFNKKFLMNRYGDYIGDKIDVIHCGLDVEKFKPGPRNPSGRPIVLAVGRLIEIKGMRYLLDACRLLKDKGMVFTCIIVGDGEEKDVLHRKSAELEIGDVVKFLGSQPQEKVFQLLQDTSIFVLPSIVTSKGGREGIPVALMEAMAMELPVVSTKTAGIPELIEDKKEGMLVEHSSADDLASAIEFLLMNAVTREKMGKRGRIKVIREFNIAHIPARFKTVFIDDNALI